MDNFNREINAYPSDSQPSVYSDGSPVYLGEPNEAGYQSRKNAASASGASHFFSLPARVCMWFVGIIVGLTLIFGCGIFWVWGLNYIGIIDTDRTVTPPTNEFNGSGGSDYSEFEDFYDYFNGIYGFPGNGMPEDDDDNSGTSQGSPGIGVTIMAVPLDFAVEDTYTAGLVITDINEKGALAGTEAQVGDLIVAVNGEACPDIDTLDKHLKATGIGGEMTLTLARYNVGVATTFEVVITLIDINSLGD